MQVVAGRKMVLAAGLPLLAHSLLQLIRGSVPLLKSKCIPSAANKRCLRYREFAGRNGERGNPLGSSRHKPPTPTPTLTLLARFFLPPLSLFFLGGCLCT